MTGDEDKELTQICKNFSIKNFFKFIELTKDMVEVTRNGVVIILGAGFSKALVEKMPLTNDLTAQISKEIKEHKNEIIRLLWKKHIEDKNIGNIDSKEKGNFEEILSYLDDCQVWKDVGTKLEHQILYEAMIPLIADAINEISIEYAKILEQKYIIKFIEKIREEQIPVITFNYDTIFEGLLINSDRINPNTEVMMINDNPEYTHNFRSNYFTDTYAIRTDGILLKAPGHMKTFSYGIGNNSLLFKLHGSKNWLYSKNYDSIICDDREFLRRCNKEAMYNPHHSPEINEKDWKQFENFITRIKNESRILIIPPIQNKSPSYMNLEPIKQQWCEARDALLKAKKIYIIGYSSPTTDLSTSLMLKDAINNKDCEISICYGPKADKILEARYEHIFSNLERDKNLKFYHKGFGEEFLNDYFFLSKSGVVPQTLGS